MPTGKNLLETAPPSPHPPPLHPYPFEGWVFDTKFAIYGTVPDGTSC